MELVDEYCVAKRSSKTVTRVYLIMYINLSRKLWKSLAAEFVGCFFLNFYGCGSILASNCYGYGIYDDSEDHLPAGDKTLCVAFAFGGVVAVNIVIFGPVSGCQINPAITIAFMTVRKIPIERGVPYIIMQILGCLSGAAAISSITPYHYWTQLVALNTVNESKDVTMVKAFVYEVSMAFVLMSTVMAVTDPTRPDPHPYVPPVIGVTIAAAVIYGVSATGASMNPARTLGSAVVSDTFTNLWLYVAGPITGTVSGAQLHYWVFRNRNPTPT